MRIGLDARKIRDTGIGRYIDRLITHLIAIEPDHHYVLYLAPEDVDYGDYPPDRVTRKVERAGKYSLLEHWSLSRKAHEDRLDLFHAPHYTLPLLMGAPSVVTIHDLIHLDDPAVGWLAKQYARFMIGKAATRADRIITVSSETAGRLAATFPWAEQKTIVIPNGGPELAPAPPDEIARVRERHGLPDNYLFYVGSDRPHKNLATAVGVIDRLPQAPPLVVVGRVKDRRPYERPNGRVLFLGHLDREELCALYSGATLFLFPSAMEGFGFPPLEAMACRTPVVASSRSAIPEVLGKAPLYADPEDLDAFAGAVLQALEEAPLRERLIEEGARQAERYSWGQTAEETLNVYQSLFDRLSR